MERLLRFSFEHARVIRLMYMEEDGKLRQVNATVIAYDDEKIDVVTTRSPRVVTIPLSSLLAADFKRGDDGMVPTL